LNLRVFGKIADVVSINSNYHIYAINDAR